MNETKRKRLEAAGWRVGETADFLELSKEETELIEIKLALSRTLRKHRGERMTQAELAAKIGSSQPRVARAESGDGSVSLDLLVRATLATGATLQEIGDAIAAA